MYSLLINRVKEYCKDDRHIACVVGTLLVGTLSYLYCMINNLNNYDNITCTPKGYGLGITLGRWLLTILGDLLDFIYGNYNINFFNILISILLICGASCVIVDFLEINNRYLCLVLSAIIISFPAIASAMFFTYTVHYYSLSILLGVIGICISRTNKVASIVGAMFFLSFSLGIYQAYYPFFASLFILKLIQKCLDNSWSWKRVLVEAIKYLGVLIGGYIVYYSNFAH